MFFGRVCEERNIVGSLRKWISMLLGHVGKGNWIFGRVCEKVEMVLGWEFEEGRYGCCKSVRRVDMVVDHVFKEGAYGCWSGM